MCQINKTIKLAKSIVMKINNYVKYNDFVKEEEFYYYLYYMLLLSFKMI